MKHYVKPFATICHGVFQKELRIFEGLQLAIMSCTMLDRLGQSGYIPCRLWLEDVGTLRVMQLIMIVALFGLVGTASMLPVLSDPEPGTVSRYAAASGEQVTCFTPSPKSTTSQSGVMGGMNMVFTATSPLIQFSLSAVGTNNIAGAGGAVGMNIGQGTPPETNAPLTGRAIISQKILDVSFASQRIPISFTDFWGPINTGQTYWLDANFNTAHGGTFTLSQITVCVASV